MELNLIGALTMYKIAGIKPNISALSRKYGKDWHTIKNMYIEKPKKERKKKESELDKYRNEIIELLSNSAVSIKAAYWYFLNEKNIQCTYDNFKTYVRKNKLREESSTGVPHPLYETEPGDQLQVDWVESIKLETINGEILEFNLFSATLGFSRFHYFEYTEFKQESDFKRCLVHFLKKVGGKTKRVLTDNMSAVVSIISSEKKIHPSVISFFKDLDIKLQLCQVRTPETKGKDEVSNKFAQWLQAYDGKIKDKEHLLKIIENLNRDINKQKNTGTNMPPVLLFDDEKEYLLPLPNKEILDSYEDEMHSCKVPSTFLIQYKGAKYSVPPYLITKTVRYKENNGKLYIYYKNDLVMEHDLNIKNSVNYDESHYKAGLKGKVKNEEDIDKIAAENLARFKNMGEK